MLDTCPVCRTFLSGYEPPASGNLRVGCPVCGRYQIFEGAALRAMHYGLENGHLYSGAIRELIDHGREVIIEDFESLLESVSLPEGPLERIDRILLHVFRHMEAYDAKVCFFENDYPVAYAKNESEFWFLLERARELGYLESDYVGSRDVRLTIEGWKHVATLSHKQTKTNQAFIAMSFDPVLRSIYNDGIKPALTKTGYTPLRVDEAQYNEKIDDRIVADIRKSGLVIADFTQHKGGVYFEAGFALGLGIPVIWICRDTDIENAHFDTRQYNHITWTDAEDLREKLVARIEATVPLKKGSVD